MSSRILPARITSTIAFRIAAGYSVLTAGSFVTLVAIAYLFLSTALANHDRDLVAAELQSLRARYLDGGMGALAESVLRNDSHSKNYPFFVRVIDRGSRASRVFLPQYWNDFDLEALERAPIGAAGAWADFPSRDGGHALVLLGDELPDGSRIQVGISTQERNGVLRRLRETFLLATVPLMALGLSGGALLAQRTLRPVRHLIETVASINSGRLEARAPRTHSGDELDDLGRLFNEMIERINALIRGMRSALDTVAHDLRTPMTRFRNKAEEALRQEGDGRAQQEALQECIEESDQILRMLNVLMDISEAENGVLQLNRRLVDVSGLAANVAEMYRFVAEEKGVDVKAAIAPEVKIEVDPERMSQALANLLDNAVKYTRSGGRVELALRPDSGRLRIRVADTGVGIDAADIDRIWDRLYRGRHDNTRGIGLGLSLVRAVVHAHGGEVTAGNGPQGGAVFEVTLPIRSPRAAS